MNDVIGSVRQVLEDFLAPELSQHRAELVAIRSELTTKIEAAESRLDGKISVVVSRLDAVESRLDSKISAFKCRTKLEPQSVLSLTTAVRDSSKMRPLFNSEKSLESVAVARVLTTARRHLSHETRCASMVFAEQPDQAK